MFISSMRDLPRTISTDDELTVSTEEGLSPRLLSKEEENALYGDLQNSGSLRGSGSLRDERVHAAAKNAFHRYCCYFLLGTGAVAGMGVTVLGEYFGSRVIEFVGVCSVIGFAMPLICVGFGVCSECEAEKERPTSPEGVWASMAEEYLDQNPSDNSIK